MFAIAGKKYYFRLDSLVSLPRKLQYVANKNRNQKKKKKKKEKKREESNKGHYRKHVSTYVVERAILIMI